ncbi:MAG: 1-deoxy-D-xylulose-5-phosphate synthase [Candidatus Omnitrophica bacterium]|nr:1-deoxy-D-xylulose-5-phosphate synthase [Candidatus Omnitrophota bacterium]
MGRILDSIEYPSDLRKLKPEELPGLAREIREAIIDTVSKTGGHLASSLGAVELAIAIHYVFNTPSDKVVWDVGHQAYPHKILTGRMKNFSSLRQLGGLSGFPNKEESPDYDIFTCGHSSTSISTALGLVIARDLEGSASKIVAVTGDASLAGGMSFEAMNHAGHENKDIIVILNDNERSISQSVGALSKYLNSIIINPKYNKIRKDVEKLVKRIPRFGFRAYRAARKLEEGLKNLLIPGMFFEEMGFRYFGPIDGHNIDTLITAFRNLMDLKEPIIIHVITKKGKGYKPAEESPAEFHGTGAFEIENGSKKKPSSTETFTEAFGNKMLELGSLDKRVVCITAAMLDGTGLNKFAQAYPDRLFDVGIAEEHAVGLGAGLARGGLRPVIALYSTFAQRSYDQMIHDVCLQNLPVILCLDRAGIVGEDGPTHHGVFDMAYLRHIPNLVFMAPATPSELKAMLDLAIKLERPVAIRYPKGSVSVPDRPMSPLELGKSEIVTEGKDVAIISIGSMLEMAIPLAERLAKKRISATVVNARFIKPLDDKMVADIARRVKRIAILEDGTAQGGFGSAVLEELERLPQAGVKSRIFAVPDKFIEHGARNELFAKYNLTPDAICDVIVRELI